MKTDIRGIGLPFAFARFAFLLCLLSLLRSFVFFLIFPFFSVFCLLPIFFFGPSQVVLCGWVYLPPSGSYLVVSCHVIRKYLVTFLLLCCLAFFFCLVVPCHVIKKKISILWLCLAFVYKAIRSAYAIIFKNGYFDWFCVFCRGSHVRHFASKQAAAVDSGRRERISHAPLPL